MLDPSVAHALTQRAKPHVRPLRRRAGFHHDLGQRIRISRVVPPEPTENAARVPHPPIFLGAFMPPALARVARVADGWIAVALPPPAMAETFEGIKAAAREAGRDPTSLKLIVRANVEITEQPLGKDRFVFTGTPDQISGDIAATREIGASELCMDATFDPDAKGSSIL